jgi:hypothetical protein
MDGCDELSGTLVCICSGLLVSLTENLFNSAHTFRQVSFLRQPGDVDCLPAALVL